MDWSKVVADALRNFMPQAPAVVGDAKGTLGQSGAASRVNADRRDAYLQYVEREISEGRQPQRFDQWISAADPMTSQVGN